MEHLNFKLFADPVESQFNKMASSRDWILLRVNIDLDQLWQVYQNAYPEEINNIFRQRKYYDGNYDRYFIKRLGSVIGYNTKTQEIETVWNVEVPEYYQTVANVMKDYVLSFIEKGKVESYFLTTERVAGHLSNTDNYDPTIIWDHFYAKIPSQYLVDKKDIGTVLGDQNTNYTLAKSSIDLISLDSLETILELIDQNSLYRGEEFESLVKSYLDFRKSLTNLSPTLVDMKCFELGIKKGGVARFKNTVIGTLATDLSEGVELDKAVASFESKVAPTNYKRTTALITPKMIKQAQETLEKVVPGRSIDLDSSVLVFDADKNCIDNIYFGRLNGKGIKHLGDDRTGNDKKSATDNEQILIDLSKVDSRAKYLVFTINSFTGETFKQVAKSYCRILDGDKEKVRVELAEQGSYTAVILAKVTKENGKWEIKNVSKTGNARTSSQLIPLAQSIL